MRAIRRFYTLAWSRADAVDQTTGSGVDSAGSMSSMAARVGGADIVGPGSLEERSNLPIGLVADARDFNHDGNRACPTSPERDDQFFDGDASGCEDLQGMFKQPIDVDEGKGR